MQPVHFRQVMELVGEPSRRVSIREVQNQREEQRRRKDHDRIRAPLEGKNDEPSAKRAAQEG